MSDQLYTFAQLHEITAISMPVLYWILHTEPISRIKIGTRTVYNKKSIADLESHMKKHDPERRFRVQNVGQGNRKRKKSVQS
jgi:hypothetical protein